MLPQSRKPPTLTPDFGGGLRCVFAVFLALFFHSRDESGGNFQLLCSRGEQSYTSLILEKPLINGVFAVTHPYSEENDDDDDPEMPDGDECIQY